MVLRISLLLAFVFISVGGEEFFERCARNDVECIKRQPLTFLSRTYAGYPKWGIEPIDPLIVTSTDVNLDNDAGVVFHFKNINITGFKNSKLDYKMDETKDNHEIQTMQADITIFSDVEVELTESKKSFKGTYYAKPTVRGKSVYGTATKGADGKQYFVLGPETTTCEVLGEPTVTIGSELQRALNQDEDAAKLKLQWEANITTLRSKVLCEIADNGFATFFKNLRALTKALDINAFYTD